MSELRLDASGLVRTFEGGVGLHGVDVQIGAGEIHALVGLNGAGKTTVMRLALGMLRPHAGRARINGRDVGQAGPSTWAEVGHLIETPLAYGELTVRQNLAMSARLHAVPRADIPAVVEVALDEFDLDEYADRRVRVLSLGNKQRVGLAAALQHRPSLIVLDEPTNGLDPSGVIRLRSALVRAAKAGAGVLVSSHHLDEVARVASRISVINEGTIIGTLDPDGADIERAFFALVLADDPHDEGA
jgi:ABC-2 type transport system ATP-binding protein